MTIADSISPREAVRAALRERFSDLINGATQRVDVDAPLFAEAPGELAEDGLPAKLWQNVPVITVKDFEAAFDATFGEKLPAPSEHTAEAATPALVIISAVCPRCQLPARIPLAVDVELHQDRDGETLHLKAKSKEAIHTCGQMQLPEPGEDAEQGSFGLDDIIGPVPTLSEINEAIEAISGTALDRLTPDVETWPSDEEIEAWNDLTKREVLAWAQAAHLSESDGPDAPATEIPPLPFVLGGEAHDPQPTVADMDAEADLGSEEDIECPSCGAAPGAPCQPDCPNFMDSCPFPDCDLAIDHAGPHGSGGDLLPV